MSDSQEFGLNSYLQLLSAVALICITFIIHNYKCFSYWSKRGIPGPKPKLLFGNTLELTSIPLLKYDNDLIANYGDSVGIYHLTTPILITRDADIVHEVTIKKFYAFIDRRDYNGNEVLINMLLATNGIRWRRLRKLMSPAFSTGKVRAMSQFMHGPIKRAIGQLSTSHKLVDLKVISSRLTLETIVRTAFGVELRDESDVETALKHGLNVLEVTKSRMFMGTVLPFFIKKWLEFTIFRKQSIEYFAQMVQAIILQRKSNPEVKRKYPDFVDLMMEASDESDDTLTPIEITANCVLILLAGFETNSNHLTTTLFALAHHQEAQDKLRAEILKVDCSTAEDLENNSESLKYLDAVIKEVSRIYPPVNRTERIAGEDITLDNGMKLEKGTVVTFAIYSLHRNPRYWSDPEKFMPERFLSENRDKFHPYAFMPFHNGPRNCIGKRFAVLQTKLALVAIIKNFKLLPSENTKSPLTFPKMANLMNIEEPVYIRMEKI